MKNVNDTVDVVKDSTPKSSTFKQVSTFPKVSLLDSIRNNDHTIQTFLLDPIDNSLDAGSTEIHIEFERDGTRWEKISIIDNGKKGMNEDQLISAFTIGESDKSCDIDLGCHGIGLQHSGLKIGRKITVKSKGKDSDLTMGTMDLDIMFERDDWTIDVYDSSLAQPKIFQETFKEFKNKLKSSRGTGTIVEFSKLDRLVTGFPANTEDMCNVIRKEIGLTYFYYIMIHNIKIYVDGVLVEGIDPLHRDSDFSHEWENTSFTHKGLKYGFKFHFLDREIKPQLRGTGDIRNVQHCGLYVYRNSRLVGRALGLSTFNAENGKMGNMFGKVGDGYSGGIRAELHMTGEGDAFQATNTKQIHDHCEMDRGFRNKLESICQEYVSRARNTDKSLSAKKTPDESKLFKTLDKSVNENPMWVREWSPVKTEFVSRGEFGPDYTSLKHKGEYILQINVDHDNWKNKKCGMAFENDVRKKLYYYRTLAEVASRDLITDTSLSNTLSREELMNEVNGRRGQLLRILLQNCL